MTKKIAVVSLGCDKNRVDTEKILYYLSSGDYEITTDNAEAQIIIVNTCAFIESARREAIDTVLEMARYKETGACELLIVAGCLVQKYRDELREALTEADVFLGFDEYSDIRKIIENTEIAENRREGRILTTPPHYAYLRIADGCNNFCTFCTIPSIRGKYRSVPIEELVSEAKRLSDDGVRELVLIAQDVTAYGKDLYGVPSLTRLLRELVKLDFKWIRLMYCYPELVTAELLDLIANEEKIAKYIDVPMQHVSDAVLKRMGRHSSYSELTELMKKLDERKIALRTTFMVGFPGETEEDFKLLCDFTEKYKPARVGIFAYSKEEGTPSCRMKGQIPKSVKLHRVNELGKIYLDCVKKHNAGLVGKTLEVIYEDMDYDRGCFVGRTQYDAPEIDANVYFTGEFADVGSFYNVKITGYDGYDLIGEIEK